MRLGITGHQERPGIDWIWVRRTLDSEIARWTPPIEGWSSLAKGTDQVFAEAVLACTGDLVAVVPTSNYERFFEGKALKNYVKLLSKSKKIELPGSNDEQEDFLTAGIYIADMTDCLFAVWDGRPSQGKGGTADVVDHALKRGKLFVHIDPFNREVKRLNG